MSTLIKNKMLTGLVILLLVANITTILFFWLGIKKRGPAPFQQPLAFIIKELSLDEKQQQQYKLLVKQHREQSKQLRGQLREAKDSFFDLMANENINDSIKNKMAEEIASLNRASDLLTFGHFKEVRKLCTPVQQQKFDRIIKDVLRMMSTPPARGERPEGPAPEGEGPP